jgi:hypothetical protein
MIISVNIFTLKSIDFLISESGFEYSIYRLRIQFGLYRGGKESVICNESDENLMLFQA